MSGFGDVPPVYIPEEKSGKDNVQHIVAKGETDKVFDDIFGSQPRKSTGPVVEVGQIQSMIMPNGWVEGQGLTVGTSRSLVYHPRSKDSSGNPVDNKDVQFNFRYRGNRLSEAASREFRQLIDSLSPSQEPRILKAEDLQKSPLNEVLGDRGHKNTFKIFSAKVERINNEPALVIEGQYTNHPVQAKIVLIDAERHHRNNLPAPVQEIIYLAKSSEYQKHYLEAKRAFDSIVWKR